MLDGLDASLFVSRVLCGDQTIAEPFDRLMVRMEQCGSGTERVVQRAGGGHRNLHLFHPVTPSDVLVQGPSEVDIEKLKSPADTQNGFSCTDKLADGVTNSLFIGSGVNLIWGYAQDGIVSDQMMTVPNNQIAKEKGFTPGQQVKSSDYYYATYGWLEGQPIIRDVNGDGKFDTSNDRCFFSADPKFTGSISANVSYKNWDFSTSLYAKVGQYSYSNFYSEYINWADRGRQKLNVDYYIPAGTLIDCDGINADGTYVNPRYQETTHYGEYPFPNNGNSNGVGNAKSYWDESKCITKTSFAKIKNITLGYTFPKEWLKPVGCTHLRLYFTVTNPFVFTNYKGFDPEWANVSSLKKDGPSTITYQIGASVKF